MKKLNGVVELHGDTIEIANYNNIQYVTIEGASTYDIYSYLKGQNFELKLDLIKELCDEMSEDQINTIKSIILGIK